jgi:hypothetical protein
MNYSNKQGIIRIRAWKLCCKLLHIAHKHLKLPTTQNTCFCHSKHLPRQHYMVHLQAADGGNGLRI